MKENKTTILELLEESYEIRGNNLSKSIDLAQEALQQSRIIKDKELIAQSLNKLALFMMIRSEHQLALTMSEEAICHFKDLGDDKGVADAKYNIAGIYYKTDNYHLGMVNLIDCLKIYSAQKDYHNQSKTHKSLGTIYELLGDWANAITSYEKAIKAGQRAQNKNLESNAYNPLSGIFLKENRIEEAVAMIERSIAMKEETGDIRGLAFAIYGRGKIHLKLENYKKAEKDFKAALKIHVEAGEHFGTGMAYNKMALLYIAMNEPDTAKDILLKSIALSEKHNMNLINFKCTYSLYQIYRNENNDSKALEYLEKYTLNKAKSANSQTLRIIENYEVISQMDSREKEAQLAREKAQMILEQERLEQSAQMKQEFLSAMSHEIRTPLNAVTSIISLLEDRSTASERKLLTALRYSSKNLLRIINDILDYSKLDTNNMRLETRPVVFNEVIENSLETYYSLARDKGLQLSVQLDEKLSTSYAIDETKVFQILGNLVSNAIKYTEEGTVFVKISKLKKQDLKDIVRFEVIDSGIGIPLDEQKRLFESFYMPPSVTTRNYGGTGLGLAIVKKLVDLHGGKIQIESNVKFGSNFYFDLELTRTEIDKTATKNRQERLTNKTAILAEDNEINALVMRQLLQKWGVTIKRVKNGLEAVQMASQEKVDYILMDIHMPEMNGYDATKAIRETENPNQHTKIFALTADVTASTQKEFQDYFDGFLLKPIQIDRILEALTKKVNRLDAVTTEV
ncbi:response regulator [Dokdonia sinensis]|uniref:histidine kinase n=1 Tax=Dokdonia sinensis TaxID=2479847 RepID=A0A3M0GFY9_9FLAO|nr:ATP-binding protein [Dokdonia sinensis]RMB56236.1 response regulator [Dokdonia sinensis]